MKKKYVQAIIAMSMAVMMPMTTIYASVPEKEQTVYVNANKEGNPKKVIVSNWLKNVDKDKELTDITDLKNIENVKGYEKFTEGTDGNIKWDADGKDIYYQGETEKELPVEVKITYYLDGKEISPKKLAGKSGNIKIKIDYINKTNKVATIDGQEENIKTPFMMVTGMILPDDKFTDVEIDHGKIIADGKNSIVMGFGFPGLKDSLQIEKVDELRDIDIPSSVTVTGKVKDFSLAMTATVATSGTLKDFGINETDDLSTVKEKINKLVDGSNALVEGSNALSEGLESLDRNVNKYASGVSALNNGINNKLLPGVESLYVGSKELSSGSKKISSGATFLEQTLNNKLASVGGTKGIEGKIGEANKNVGLLKEGSSSLAKGIENYTNGADAIYEKTNKYVSAVGVAKNGVNNELLPGVKKLKDGIDEYTKGADMAYDGANNKLLPGVEKFNKKAIALDENKKYIGGKVLNAKLATSNSKKLAENIENGIKNLNIDKHATSAEEMKKSSESIKNNSKSLLDELNKNEEALEKGSASTLIEKQNMLTNSAVNHKNSLSNMSDKLNLIEALTKEMDECVKISEEKLAENSALLIGSDNSKETSKIRNNLSVIEENVNNVKGEALESINGKKTEIEASAANSVKQDAKAKLVNVEGLTSEQIQEIESIIDSANYAPSNEFTSSDINSKVDEPINNIKGSLSVIEENSGEGIIKAKENEAVIKEKQELLKEKISLVKSKNNEVVNEKNSLLSDAQNIVNKSYNLKTSTNTYVDSENKRKDALKENEENKDKAIKEKAEALYNETESLDENAQSVLDGANEIKEKNIKLQENMEVLKKLSAALDKDLGFAIAKAGGKEGIEEKIKSVKNDSDNLMAGTNLLCIGLKKLNKNSGALREGAGTLVEGTQKTSEGLNMLSENGAKLDEKFKDLADNSSNLRYGANRVDGGILKLYMEAKNLNEKKGELISDINKGAKGASLLADGARSLNYGIDNKLCPGINTLKSGVGDLSSGSRTLASKNEALLDGTKKLNEGGKELRDGTKKFNDEGVKEIENKFVNQMESFIDRLRAVKEADEEYKAFDGANNMDGRVKFIIETSPIEK